MDNNEIKEAEVRNKINELQDEFIDQMREYKKYVSVDIFVAFIQLKIAQLIEVARGVHGIEIDY